MPVTTRSRSTPATDGAVDTAQPTTRAVKPEEAGRHGNGAVAATSPRARRAPRTPRAAAARADMPDPAASVPAPAGGTNGASVEPPVADVPPRQATAPGRKDATLKKATRKDAARNDPATGGAAPKAASRRTGRAGARSGVPAAGEAASAARRQADAAALAGSAGFGSPGEALSRLEAVVESAQPNQVQALRRVLFRRETESSSVERDDELSPNWRQGPIPIAT